MSQASENLRRPPHSSQAQCGVHSGVPSICPFLAVLDCNPTSSKPHSPWLNVHTRSGWPSHHRDPRMDGWVTIRQVCCGYDLFVGPLPTLVWWVLSSWTISCPSQCPCTKHFLWAMHYSSYCTCLHSLNLLQQALIVSVLRMRRRKHGVRKQSAQDDTEVEPGFRPWLTILFQEAPACLQGAGFVCLRV